MSVKYLNVNTAKLIERCRTGDRQAQRLLYEKYADALLGICRRYLPKIDEAEDAFLQGFAKAFRQLDKLEDASKFDFWIRRIMANECLMMLRKKKKMRLTEIQEWEAPAMDPKALERLTADDILSLVNALPDGYRTIFNLYVIEGYKHREIADMLDISVNTSKSQLIMARRKLQEQLEQLNLSTNTRKSAN